MRQVAWNVYWKDSSLKGYKLLDTVFFDEDCDKEYVYDSLVNHDGYPTDIKILEVK